MAAALLPSSLSGGKLVEDGFNSSVMQQLSEQLMFSMAHVPKKNNKRGKMGQKSAQAAATSPPEHKDGKESESESTQAAAAVSSAATAAAAHICATTSDSGSSSDSEQPQPNSTHPQPSTGQTC
jgi:hypothetical protein